MTVKDSGFLYDIMITDIAGNFLSKIHNWSKTNYKVQVGENPLGLCVDVNDVSWTANFKSDTVSKVDNGKCTTIKLMTGSNPFGICVDKNNAIWVTNSGLNTVSEIVNGVRMGSDIPVGAQPRGIACDRDNAKWVANFMDHTVSKIVNNVVVATIPVGKNPFGVCVDKDNKVYVTCHGDNMVYVIDTITVKVYKQIKVGKSPRGICVDKDNTIWVANGSSNTVSRIVKLIKLEPDIVVGTGPYGICMDKDNSVIVTNLVSCSITKITNGVKTGTDFVVDGVPVNFGDATGMQAFLLFNPSNFNQIEKILWDDLDPSLQKIIASGGTALTTIDAANVIFSDGTTLQNKLNSGFLKGDKGDKGEKGDPGDASAASDASKVAYGTMTVQQALDQLLYKATGISSFTNNVNTVERGKVINSVTFNWALNKAVTSQSINNGVGSVPVGTTTKTVTGLNITNNTTFTLTADDGTTNTGHSTTASTSINFSDKRYWGVSAKTALSDADILALSSEFASSRATTKVFDATGGKYVYLAMPTSFACDTSKFKVGGLYVNAWELVSRQFVNASGYSVSYDIFRSTNIQTGSAISVEIV